MSRPDQGGQALGNAREAQVFKGTTDAGPEAVVVIVTKLMGQCLMELLESSETRWGRRHILSALLRSSLATLLVVGVSGLTLGIWSIQGILRVFFLFLWNG